MDPILHNSSDNISVSKLPWWSRFSLTLLTTLVAVGCQSTRFQDMSLPVPPTHLRYDSPMRHPGDSIHTNDGSNPGETSNVDAFSVETESVPENGNSPQADQDSPYLIRYQSPEEESTRRGIRSLLAEKSDSQTDDAPLELPQGVGELSLNELDKSTIAPADASQLIKEVIIKGNQRLPTHHLTRNMGTRAGRYYDPDRLQEDIDRLWKTPDINRVNGPFLEQTPEGVVITIEVFERSVINGIKFIGNRGLTDKKLLTESELEVGAPVDVYKVRTALSRIEELYKSKGFPRTQVEVLEGSEADDAEVVFLIHEDQKQRIWQAEFEGNKIATDARLRSLIESKPGYFKLIGGLVKRDEIEQDILRLTNYYRSLGFFNARIGREVEESNDGRWITVRFIISEGPRYRVRNVGFVGNQVYPKEELESLVKLKPGEEGSPQFNSAKMNADVVALRDLYGGNGYVFANVEAEPRFLEEPGLLDIVYRITEGKQYRAGDINVHFAGNAGVTRREVVMNRLSIRPGDVIDVREIRNSKLRLGSAQIFADQSSGKAPEIVVRPPELKDLERHAQAESSRY
jgi:outer membrane protein insertion porin family